MTGVNDWINVSIAVLGVAFTLVLGVYLILRLRARRGALKSQLADSPLFADDRAHNQIQLVRSEIAVLAREGVDVARPRALLNRAEAEVAKHENVDAIRTAREAHGLLVELRARGSPSTPGAFGNGRPNLIASVRSPTVPAGPSPGARSLVAEDPGNAEPTSVAPPPLRPPKNRMEAHFEMTLLVEELARPPASAGGGSERTEAEALRKEAQAAYAREEYTEALRLALRGRRRLGAHIESLPATSPKSGGADASPTSPPLPAQPAASGAGTSTCPSCGQRGRAGDTFCRSCGTPFGSGRCPRCHEPLDPRDGFCGRCGSPVTPP